MENNSVIKIGIAEDQAIYREGLQNLLNSFDGVRVVFAVENGQELIDKLQHHKVDVVFLDYRMPVLNGLETVRRIRKFEKKLKILIISMYDDNVFVEQTIESGANGYLSKDDNPEEIERAVFSCMETGYYLSDRTSKMLISKLMVNGKIKPQIENQIIDFTPFELQVLQMICKEYTTQEIADTTFKSRRTIEGARTLMMQKVGARNVVGLVMYAVKHNLVSEEINE
jgi:two-component system, NarL family, response regulator NreC